ncbi:MAG: response regulator [Deltaproteobacteria bacterium]|nr:response regulator [Deltaproteobacteria bacterium]
MSDRETPQTAKILLVDDDYDFRLQNRLQLEAEGYSVVESESEAAAREFLEREQPDLVVVDLMLEEEDSGFGLCYFIKKHWPNLPIIIVTGVAAKVRIEFEAATAEERAWIKADTLMAKPVRFEQLLAEIERLLAQKT